MGDIANLYDNLRVPIAENLRQAGSTPYYGATGLQGYIDGYTHEGEFVLLAEDGASDLSDYPAYLISGLSWVNNHAHVLQADKEYSNNFFLLYSLKTLDYSKIVAGTSRAKLNASALIKLELKTPDSSEQQQIGTFFNGLDSLSTLHQRERIYWSRARSELIVLA